MKRGLRTLSILIILVGLILIASSSLMSITGSVISESVNIRSSVLGLAFIIGGLALFLAEKESKLISLVKRDDALYNLARELKGNEIIQGDINHLLYELNKGNENPGLGTRKLFGSISYLRGRKGGRVFYRPIEDNKYEILAYAIGTGQGGGKHQSERKVMNRLREKYKKTRKKVAA